SRCFRSTAVPRLPWVPSPEPPFKACFVSPLSARGATVSDDTIVICRQVLKAEQVHPRVTARAGTEERSRSSRVHRGPDLWSGGGSGKGSVDVHVRCRITQGTHDTVPLTRELRGGPDKQPTRVDWGEVDA